MKDFIKGFVYPFKSFGLFFKYPKTIALSIIPVTINMIIYISSFIIIFSKVMDFGQKISGSDSPQAGFWHDLFYITIIVLSFIILLIICYFIMIVLGGIISAPFNENISLLIEENITGKKSDYHPGFIKDTWLNILSEIKKLLFYFGLLFIFFLIGFIPLIGSIFSVVLSTIFSFFYNAMDFFDYPMTRQYYTLKNKIRVTASKPFYSLGFGCASFLIMFLPVINVLLKPLCVVSGTAFYFEKGYNLIKKEQEQT